jgi:WD40 repeat protein
VYKIESELRKYESETKILSKNPEDLLSNRGVAPLNIFSHEKKLNNNTKKIGSAFKTISLLRTYCEDVKRGLHSYANSMKITEQIRKIEDVGLTAKQANIFKPSRIVYKYSKEDKVGTYEDHLDIIQDDLKAEKDARAILESSSRKGLIIKKFTDSRLNTGQSGHKETAESLTQPLYTNENRKISDDFKKVETDISQPVDIPISRSYISPKVNSLGYIDNVKHSYTLPYEQNILQSRVYTDKNKSLLQSEPMIASRTILTQPTDYSSSTENERLRRQIEDLRKQNEELDKRINVERNILPQSDVGRQKFYEKEKKPVDSLPVIVRNHHPIRSRDFILKKSVKSEIQRNYTKILPIVDTEYIIAGTRDGLLLVYKFIDLENIQEYKAFKLTENSRIKSLCYLNDSLTVFIGTGDGKLLRMNLDDFSVSRISLFDDAVKAIVYLMNGFSLLVASGNNIYEVDILNRKNINYIEAHDGRVNDLLFNQAKEMFISCSEDKSIKIWNSKTKECLGILQGHNEPVKSICFAYSHDFIYLASIAKEASLVLWNLSDKNFTKTFPLSSLPKTIFYLWDKKSIIITFNDGTFCLWDIENDKKVEFHSNYSTYQHGCYLDDGQNIVLVNKDGALEFWNAQ